MTEHRDVVIELVSTPSNFSGSPLDMSVPQRIVFVCSGNTCRSPMAEAMFRRLQEIRPALARLEVGSAGISPQGNGAAAEAVRVLAEAEFGGRDLSRHRPRRLTREAGADLILAMDSVTLADARRLSPDSCVDLLGDYSREAGKPAVEVPDPYGRSENDYRRCAQVIKPLVDGVADWLAAHEPKRFVPCQSPRGFCARSFRSATRTSSRNVTGST